jgi:subtilisin family serine protease
VHGTLVAGVLTGKRGSGAPAICPGCTLLLRPIFGDSGVGTYSVPSATPEVLADAIIEAVAAGTWIINLSCGIARCSGRGESSLRAALDFAGGKGVIVVAAAGNQGRVGGSCITQHPWVIPVVSIDRYGQPANECILSASTGLRGLAAPGQNLLSIDANGEPMQFSGTSAACPLVSGAAALLWSEYPDLTAAQIKDALVGGRRQRSIVPPTMDAWSAFQKLGPAAGERKTA